MRGNNLLDSNKTSWRQKLLSRALGGKASAVLRGMATLAVGSGVAKVVGIAAMPLLTRLYVPEEFGLAAVFAAVILLLVPLFTLRYELALPLPRGDGSATNLLALGLLLIAAATLISGLALSLCGAPLLRLVAAEGLAPWWWLLLVGSFTAGTYALLSGWATRQRNYKVIAQTSVAQQLAGDMVKVGLGALSAGTIGLLIGTIVAKGAGSLTLISKFGGTFRENWRFVRWHRMRKLAFRYRSFPIYRLPSQLLLVLSTNAPVFIVTAFFSTEDTGQLALALATVALPVAFISHSMAGAFYAEAAQSHRQGDNLVALAASVAKRCAAASVVPAIAVVALSPLLFPWVFGDDWRPAGILAALLGIGLVPTFVSQTILKALPIIGRNDVFFVFNLTRLGLTAGSLIIPAWLGYNIYTCVAIYVGATCLQKVGQTMAAFKLLSIHK
jgi:O-antigen/teichoic acid export membrane protein